MGPAKRRPEDLSPEELRAALRETLASRELRVPDEAGAGFDAGLWAQMADLGWLGLGAAEADGGLDLGFAHMAVLFEELGGVLASVPAIPTLLAGEALRLGGGAVAKRWASPLAAGESAAAFALPQAGALTAADGRLHGAITLVVDADKAHLLFLPLRTPDGGGLVVLEANTPGVQITAPVCNDLTRRLCTVEVEGVAFDGTARLDLSPIDWDRLADRAAVALACDSVGGAAAILARTVDYMRLRVQFDRPIGTFQALKHRAAEWKVRLEAAHALTRQAAEAVTADAPDAPVLAAAAKFYACDVYVAIAEDAIQLHGGIGFTWEHVCHLYLRRARLNQALLGSSRQFKDRVAALAFAPPEVDAPSAVPDFLSVDADDLMEPAS